MWTTWFHLYQAQMCCVAKQTLFVSNLKLTIGKVQYNYQQAPPFTQEAPGTSNQLLQATAMHVQHSKKWCSFRTLYLSALHLLCKTAISSPIPCRESRRKIVASGWKRRKTWKGRMGHNSNLCPLFFFPKRGQSESQHLHSSHYFRDVTLGALRPPRWTASSANQLWALCCHCWPLNTAAGCRKTSALPQSQPHWSAAPSCLAAAIQGTAAAAAAATTEQGLSLTAVTTLFFTILSFSSFLHLKQWTGFTHLPELAFLSFFVPKSNCPSVPNLTNFFFAISILFSPLLPLLSRLGIKTSFILCCYSFSFYCLCPFPFCLFVLW